MKKQKSKKKLSKVETARRDVTAKFIADSKNETLDLAPQTPLGMESQAEFAPADFHKD